VINRLKNLISTSPSKLMSLRLDALLPCVDAGWSAVDKPRTVQYSCHSQVDGN